jgi:hypothetical protein
MTNQIPDKFTWGARAKPEKLPPAFATDAELHFSPHYGPHICQACWGARWMRATQDTETTKIGDLVKCDTCGMVNSQAINRALGQCWELSGLKPQHPAAQTFETCPANDKDAFAMLRAARRFAASPEGWLTFYGTRGGLKSGMGESITRFLLSYRIPCLFIRSPQLWEYCGAVPRSDGDETDYAGRRRWVATVDVLVIDELGVESNSAAVAAYRLEVLDARYQAARRGDGGATVLLSMYAPETWAEPAVASRAQDSRFVCLPCAPVDYRKSRGPNARDHGRRLPDAADVPRIGPSPPVRL